MLLARWNRRILGSLVNSFKNSFHKTMSESSSNRSLNTVVDTSLSNRLIWIDCEMTGLDVDTCRLIEIACIITEGDSLDIVAECPSLIIYQPPHVVDGMSDWCKSTFAKTGLTKAVQNSKVSEKDAEFALLEFVRQHTEPGVCPLAGNTVHMDKRFLVKYMPKFVEHLHYRIVDVSTVKELCRRWFPEEFKNCPKKQGTHRALDDIKESIEELKYYRKTIFKENAN